MASLDTGRQRLVFPPAKLLPHVGYLDWSPPTLLAPLSKVGHSSQHSALAPGANNWMLADDFSCFILGSHEITLQRAHLVNTVRADARKGTRVVSAQVLVVSHDLHLCH